MYQRNVRGMPCYLTSRLMISTSDSATSSRPGNGVGSSSHRIRKRSPLSSVMTNRAFASASFAGLTSLQIFPTRDAMLPCPPNWFILHRLLLSDDLFSASFLVVFLDQFDF